MHPFPHRYTVTTSAGPQGDILIEREGLPSIPSDAPIDFDGPGGRWSPEDLLVAAVADCLALTFRGIARVSRLPWTAFRAEVTGTLDRIEKVTQFTHFEVVAHVEIPEGASAEQARRIAEKAEATCLITRSLKATIHLDVHVSLGVSRAMREIPHSAAN
jgi:organic hydroperoxide reductase OsmC/OhrA